MPRKPKVVFDKRGSFVGIPSMLFRVGRGRREGEIVDEVFYDKGAFLGKGGWRSMYRQGAKRSIFRRKK
jgi:hypothetical protein